MPAARHASRPSCVAFAVNAITGMRLPVPSRRRSSAVAENPSMTGIWQSIRTTSNLSTASISSAWRPSAAVSDLHAERREHALGHFAIERLVLDDQHASAQRGARRGQQRRSAATARVARHRRARSAQLPIVQLQAQRLAQFSVEVQATVDLRARQVDEAREPNDARSNVQRSARPALNSSAPLVGQRVVDDDRVVRDRAQLLRRFRHRAHPDRTRAPLTQRPAR